MPRLLDDPNDPRWLEAERRDIFLRGLLPPHNHRERLPESGGSIVGQGVSASANLVKAP